MTRFLVILLVAGGICVSCTSMKDVLERCLTSDEIDFLLPTLETAADSNAKAQGVPVTKTTDGESTCHKHIFLRSGHRLVIFSTPNDPDTSVRATLSDMNKKVRTKECFEKAKRQLLALGRPTYSAVLEEHRKRWGWLWDDLDTGPVKWLQCDKENGQAWSMGLNTMVHELNHENALKECLFFPKDGRRLCFAGTDELPKGDLAKLNHFPTTDKVALGQLFGIQELYLTNNPQSPIALFDELNSYILSSLVMSDLLKKNGPSAIVEKNWRPVSNLPLIMFYSAIYLERLKRLHPKEFAKWFGVDSANLKNLEILFKEGEAAHAEWKSVLSSKKLKELPVETAIWREYQDSRRKF